MRRTRGLRLAAIRKAQQAKQERDAKRLRRERQVEAALAEYFEHVALAEAVATTTAAKIADLQAAAATAIGRERGAAAVALGAMVELGETRTAIAELTGLTLSGVRDLLTAAESVPVADPPMLTEGNPRPATYGHEPAFESLSADRDVADPDPAVPAASYPEVGYDAAPYTSTVYPAAPYAEPPDTVPPDTVPPDTVPPDAGWARAPDRTGDAWAS